MNSIARLEETWHGEVPVAAVFGEIDASNAHDIGERLRALLTNRLSSMVVDLSEVSYLDSAGLNVLFALGEQMRGRQQRLIVVVSKGSPIDRMVKITGLGMQVAVRASLDEALAEG